MPSNRRVRAVLICGIVAIIITLYVSSSASSTRSSPFYTSTRDALSQRQAEEAHGAALESDDSAVQARLREAEEKAKKAADKKGDEFHSEEFKSKAAKVKAEVDMSRASGDGGVAKKDGSIRKDFRGGSEKVLMEAEGKAEKERQKEKEESEKSPEERKAEAELNYILKRSPSMFPSYYPSQRADQGSYYLLKVVLPILEEGQEHPAHQIRHHTPASCCRTRPA